MGGKMNKSVQTILGLLLIGSCLAYPGPPLAKKTVATVEDFHPGDTLRYTTDGSIPDRTSRFVLFGANQVMVTRTTTFNARLYRPGFSPSSVQSQTVYVRDSVFSDLPVVKR
jgi:hypothetical protein